MRTANRRKGMTTGRVIVDTTGHPSKAPDAIGHLMEAAKLLRKASKRPELLTVELQGNYIVAVAHVHQSWSETDVARMLQLLTHPQPSAAGRQTQVSSSTVMHTVDGYLDDVARSAAVRWLTQIAEVRGVEIEVKAR